MARCGSQFWLEIQHPTLNWVDLHGQQSTTGTVSNEQVDVTTKETMSWRKLSNCGMRMGTISASGVVADRDSLGPDAQAVTTWINEQAAFGNLINARIRVGTQKIILSGLYQVASYERTGDHNDAEKYSITLESSNSLTDSEFPIFSIFPPDNFAHGWGVTRLNTDYLEEVGTMYRVADGAQELLLFTDNNAGPVADVQQVESFAQGGEVLLVVWRDQAPPGTLPGGNPEPPLDAYQLDINRAPRITDENGVALVNSAGILEVEFQWVDPTVWKEFDTDIRNYNPANADSAIGGFALNPRAWSSDDSLIYHPQFSLRTLSADPEYGGRVFGAGTPLNAFVPGFDGNSQCVYTGLLGDQTDKQLMINGVLSPDFIPATGQSWGSAQFRIGHGSGGGSGYRGRMQQGWFYFADPARLSPEFVENFLPEIQRAVANACGFDF